MEKLARLGLWTAMATALFSPSFVASANTLAYGEAFDTLYRVDLTTRIATRIGSAGSWSGTRIANVEGLTYAPNGNLYAVSDTLLKVLLRIDPGTGLATPIGTGLHITDQGGGTFNALDFGMTSTCDGKLLLSSGYSRGFWTVDPGTGVATKIGNFSAGTTITGLATNRNTIYGAGSQNTPNLYLIDRSNAQITLAGTYAPGINTSVTTASPGFDASHHLWMMIDNVPPLTGGAPEWSELTSASFWDDNSLYAVENAPGSSYFNSVFTDVGQVTGPVDLQYIGIKGLAIAPPNCAPVILGPGSLWFGGRITTLASKYFWDAPSESFVDVYESVNGGTPTRVVNGGGATGNFTATATDGHTYTFTLYRAGTTSPVLSSVTTTTAP